MPKGALDTNLSLMPLNDRPAKMQAQSETDPTATLNIDPANPVEALPNALLLVYWHSRTGVVDPHACSVVIS